MQDYLEAMACAANYAWVNRSTMTFLVRQAFAKQFKKSPVSHQHASFKSAEVFAMPKPMCQARLAESPAKFVLSVTP